MKTALVAVSVLSVCACRQTVPVSIVPQPSEVKQSHSTFEIQPDGLSVCPADASLEGLVAVWAETMEKPYAPGTVDLPTGFTRIVSAVSLPPVAAAADRAEADVLLALDPSLADEEYVLEISREHLSKCQKKMSRMCRDHFPRHFENIQTMPGVGERSATAIIAEVGVDMGTFETSSALVSWAGLKPRNDESAGKIKSRRITHGNKYLRKSMVECSWAAAKTRNCFFNRFSYTQTVVRHKNRQKVQVAIARKMLVAVWHILTEGVAYREYLDHQEAA